MWFNICLFVIAVKFGQGSYPMPLVEPRFCKESEFFDPSRLTCKPCSTDQKQLLIQRRTADGLSCECVPNHKIVSFKNGRILCESCPENEVTSWDGWRCLRCSSSHPFLNSTQSCSACKDGIEVESPDLELQCISCPETSKPDDQHQSCARCQEDMILASNGTCTCPKEKFLVSGGTCIPELFRLPADEAWATLTLENGKKIKSALIRDHLQAVIYQCKVLQNWTSCQMLGNLCVLSLYKTASSKENSAPCDQYLKLTNLDSQRPVQLPEGVPQLFYPNGDAHLDLSRTNVPNKFSLKMNSKFSTLSFVAAKYSLQGDFLDLSNVTQDLLQLCKFSSKEIEDGFVFGAQIHKRCKLGASSLLAESELVFYELYLLHSKQGQEEMYPVPVLITNLEMNDELINKESKQSRWQLTRRFFLTDPVSGLESEESSNPAKVLRYARSLSIKIKVRDEDESDVGSIYPPLLVLEYAELNKDDFTSNRPVQMSFDVSYEMAQSKTFHSISVAVAVLSVLSVIWSLFQTWSWFRRAGKSSIDIQTLGKFLVYGSGNLGNVFFLVILCASVNWLVIFKRQDVVHLLLPTPEQEETLVVYISAAFALKLLQILHMLIIQSTIDIFFIDWERPGSRQRGVNARATSVRMVDETNMHQSGDVGQLSGMGLDPIKQSNSEKTSDGGGVSIWRTYFVSSTWADLQTLRRVRPGLQLFLLLSFLQVFGFENVTLIDPRSSLSSTGNPTHSPFSITCRFAIAASLFLTIAFFQYMVHRIVYERFFDDRLQQFIDLCSVSNISVFIMSLPRYGYYIHGRSAHGRADVNMKEMHQHLRREEEDLCGHRGLLPNTEQQTFCMALPEGLADQYKRLLLPLTSYSQTADRMQGVGGRLARVDVERVVHTYQMVNKFLSGFIEHAFKELDYAVKDPLLLENLLDVEFTEVQDKGYFYNDNSHSFDSLLFCGQESCLIVFESLLFCLVDLAAQDFTLAATLTYLFYKVIEIARKSAGRRNLVRKALVDERFLNS